MHLKRKMLGIVIFAAAIGCASTVVKKNPGPHDHGVRYWRPKPYMMIEPAGEFSADQNMLKLSIKYLPDYNEEYSIHVRAGVGTNKTGFKLDQGWNLTEMAIDVDSKTNENISAVGDFLGKAAPLLKGGSGPVTQVAKEQSMLAYGKHVPMGLYESVVTCGPDGVKRLCGWRYVGFAPFAGCGAELVQACGSVTELYGLISRGDQLVFEKLPQLEQITPKVREAVQANTFGNSAPKQ